MELTAEVRPNSMARITGVVYLAYFVIAVAADLVGRGIIVSGDAASTATNILSHESAYRVSIGVSLIGTAVYIALTALLYYLFKPVNGRIALIAAFLSVVGCAIQAVGTAFQVAPLILLGGHHYLSSFNTAQLNAIAFMFLHLNDETSYIYLVFFGLFDLLIGYLILRSTFLPRFLGVLMALAGLGWLAYLSPPFAQHLSPYDQTFGFLAELVLMFWLLIKGVDPERWTKQVADHQERSFRKNTRILDESTSGV